jgi:hypothetical protein
MSDLLRYLTENNIDPDTLLLPTKNRNQGWVTPSKQNFYPGYNIASGTELKDIDFESGSNMRSLEDVRGDVRAEYQSGFEKFYNSIGQGVGTFGTALASTVAVLASAPVALGAEIATRGEAEGLDIMLNNPVMKGINEFDKFLKEDLLPTYYTKEQQEKVFSAAFGTDAVNGLGFLLSNVVPTGAVTKVFGSWAKMLNASKAGKASAMLDDAMKAGKITNIEAQIVNKTAKFIDNMGPFVGAAVGRLGESAIEAYGSYTDIKETLTAERDKARFELETYGTTAREDLAMLSDEDIEKRAKEQRNNIFGGNMAMFVSDALQFSRLFKGGNSLASRLTKDGLLNTVKKQGKLGLAKEYLKESLQEAAEEGFQYLLQEGGKRSAIDGGSFLSNMDNSFGDLFSTVEGKRSMLLGALLGGGMSAVRNIRNSKEVKARLQSLVQNLNQSGATGQRYIKDENGQLIINPEISKIATTFMQYEAMKEEALSKGDLVAYEFAEKSQFAELVAAKIDAGQFEDFITELQGLSKASQEEVEAMFGELPERNGNKLTPSQLINEKIAEAKRLKELVEGVDRLPGMNEITRQGKNVLVTSLLAQDSLRNVYNKVETELAEVMSRAQVVPNEDGTFTTKLLPQDQALADVLEQKKQEAFDSFYEASKVFDMFSQNVKEAEEMAEEAKEEAVKNATKEYEDSVGEEERKKQEAVEEGAVISDPETGEERIATDIDNETGEVLDQNGQPIDTNLLFQEEDNPDPIESTNDVDTKVEARENIEEEDYDKKLGVNASTGTAFNIIGGERQIKDGEYEIDPKFERQVKVMADPTISNNVVDNPNANPNVIEYKLEIVPITDEEISRTNQRRAADNQPPLTKKDFEENTDYTPIQMTLMVNGNESKSVVSFYHNPEYFRKTAEYAQYVKEFGTKKAEELTKERIAELSKQRAKLVEDIKAGKNIVQATSKSEGVLNYNPTVTNEDGSRTKKLNGVLNILASRYEELLNGKDHSLWVVNSVGGKVRVKTKGIQVVTNVEVGKDFVKTTFMDSSGKTETVTTKNPMYNVGEMTFEVVTSNGSTRKIAPFNSEEFTNSQIESLTDLIMDRLMGNQTINIKGTTYNIIGSEQNPGIVDSLIYVGNVKSQNADAIRSQLAFTKSGKLLLGKETIEQPTDQNYQEIRQKVRSHIIGYKSKPQFKIKSVKYFTDNFGIPEKTEDGWVMNNPKGYTSFMFGGENALIKTALNKNMFVNSYFLFAESNGDILTRSDKSVETKPVIEAKKADIVFSEKEELEIAKFKKDINTEQIEFSEIFKNEKDKTTLMLWEALKPYIRNGAKIYHQDGYYFAGSSELAAEYGYAATIDGKGNVLIFDKTKLDSDTILHELLHDFLFDAININKDEVLITELQRIFDKVKEDTDLVERYSYAFSNLDEFVSEVFGNRGFRQELSYIKDFKLNRTSSIFDSVSNAIKNFLNRQFGFKINNTVLDNIFNAVEHTVKGKNKEINAKYSTEPKALEQSSTTTSSIEAKKAEIEKLEKEKQEELNWENKINNAKNKEDLLKIIEDISGRTSSDMSMGFNASIPVASQFSEAKKFAIQDLKAIEKFFLKGISNEYDAQIAQKQAELKALEEPIEPTVVDKAIEEKQKECEGGVDSPKSLKDGFDIFDNID